MKFFRALLFPGLTKSFLIIALFLGSPGSLFAQANETDSLIKLLNTSIHDTTRVKILITIGELIYSEQPDSAITLFQDSKSLAEANLNKIKTSEGKDADLLRSTFSKSLADANYDLGYLQVSKGDFPNGLEYYHQSLKIRESYISPVTKKPDQHGIAQTLNDIGVIYHKQENWTEALNYYKRSMKIRQALNDQPGVAQSLNNIGVTFKSKNDLSNALKNYMEALAIQEKIGDKEGLAYTLNNLAGIYKDSGDPDCKADKSTCEEEGCKKALVYLNRSLKIHEEINDKAGVAFSKNNIASVLFKLKRYDEALVNAKQSLEMGRELGFPEIISRASQTLSKLYSQSGDYKSAYEMHVLYKQMADSINNEKSRKLSIKREFEYVYEKKLATDSIKSLEERKIFAVQMEKERTQRMGLYLGISLIAVFSGFMYNRFRVTRRQKDIIAKQKSEVEEQKIQVERQSKIIEEKNKDITDSITYAKRIQQAKLPQIEEITLALPDSFVLFKPKDIVSGDFYFFHRQGEIIFLAAADCTGHGVPGALMSMICSEQLNDAVKEHTHPSDILSFVNRGLKKSLRQSATEGSTRDGMDIALCAIDLNESVIHFAGANRPLWIIRKGSLDLEEVKATKTAIGGFTNDDQQFESHRLDLKKGDCIYMTTDGYADSFSKSGKKLTTKKFKQLLLDINSQSMSQQRNHLEAFIENWMGDGEQVDDVLVIGVRV